MTPDKNAVMCPCRDNMLLYFVYIHKAEHEREAPEVLSPSLFNPLSYFAVFYTL
jgi:hypothetical protein